VPLIFKDEGRDNRIETADEGISGGCHIRIRGDGNSITLGRRSATFEAATMLIEGDGNSIHIGERCGLRRKAHIQILGSGNRVEIGSFCGGRIRVEIRGNQSVVSVGDATTFVRLRLVLYERGRISLGRDCMLSLVSIWNSDLHSVLDLETGRRINPPADVTIGDRVWIGHDCKILKGSTVGAGSVIGTASVVTGEIPENCIAAGNPATVRRKNVSWSRELLPFADDQ
jgi:acetyltransferase-like isoleucine patch superfamily enzyme